ncbi:MAG: extracellular solute-binding protein [Eubacteriales bacterium]|nr:extracellular solute-binding protein [Eubacteriales bacterium]
MKIKQVVLVLLTAAMTLGACQKAGREPSEAGSAQKGRDAVTVYCWGEHMIYNGYAAYVQSQIPEADVVFVAGSNSMDYYEFMNENSDLPDILTVRRMSMIDAEDLRDCLMDLSETETAASFNNIYLENYRFEDGSINWLPACGEVDGYIANLDLFEEYGVPIPRDRASFDEACQAFREAGIMPYTNDFGRDYSCLETLQGLSIQELMTGEGILWRMGYEGGENRQLDDAVWPAAFERLERQLEVWGTPKEAAEYGYFEMVEPFLAGEAALMRGTGNDVISCNEKGMNVGMLPYFGDTPEDSWLLTYPSFNVAVNQRVSQDPDHEALCMRVLDVMLSEEAQGVLAGNHNMIPYNTGAGLELDKSMEGLEKYVENNHLYLRLASTEIFDASLCAVTGMVRGEYDAGQAYDAFNQRLRTKEEQRDEVVVHFDKGYSSVFDPEKGNEAASAITNTLREYFGSDILIALGSSYSGVVYGTDYTRRQLDYMITDTTIHDYTNEVTGKELRHMLESILEKEYGGISMLNRYFLPVTSGCQLTVAQREDGYHLEKLTVDGKEMGDEDTFLVTYIASVHNGEPMLEELWKEKGGVSAWEQSDLTVQEHWSRCILGGQGSDPYPLAEPTRYIRLT